MAPLRVLADTSFLIQRSNLSKSELPILRIFVSDGALRELVKKRNSVLSENFAILLPTDNAWVKASILWSDGGPQKKAQATLRLKGDWARGGDGDLGHFENIRKLSFRVKVGGNEQILGMTKFSIHHPRQRGFQNEAIAADMMRLFGILSPRYFFVDVRINDQTIGVMALEEHFTKELLESQSRRNGPILAIDDELYWQQYFLNGNRVQGKSGDWIGTDSTNLVFRDYPIKVYRGNRLLLDTIHSQQVVRAVSLLRDQIDGRISGSLTYDLDLMSRWWILVNILQAAHANSVNNQRFYFNPIANRLEPISFDHGVDPRCRFALTTDFAVSSIITDRKFRKILSKDIREIENILTSKKFKVWLAERKEQYQKILSLEGNFAEALEKHIPIHSECLVHNLAEFKRELHSVFDVIPIAPYKAVHSLSHAEYMKIRAHEFLGTKRLEDRIDDSIHGQEFMEQSPPLYTHIRPVWFWSKEKADIEIKNLTLDPVTINSVFLVKEPWKNLLAENVGYGDYVRNYPDLLLAYNATDGKQSIEEWGRLHYQNFGEAERRDRFIQIPAYEEGSREHIRPVPIRQSGFDLGDEMKIGYTYRGTKHTKPLFLQFRHHDSGYESVAATKRWLHESGIVVNETNKTIIFPRGHHILDKRLEVERGWQTKFLSGAMIDFKQGAALKLNGPIYSLGQKNVPVTLVVNSNPDQGLLGSWGGLVVVNAQTESILRYTRVVGSVGSRLPERQDSYGLTGCITFYKSDVLIEDSVFDDLQCEDALNIVSSNFTIRRLEVIGANADAFDSDYSTGTVTNSRFSNIANDGIDISGSEVEVKSSQFVDIGDKAISVGEKSNLNASGLTIDRSVAGVVSKDKSVAHIYDSNFGSISGSALMAYTKKEEYGPAEIYCTNCVFDNVESVAAKQFESRITIDGKQISTRPFSRSQLQVAGYVSSGKFAEKGYGSVQY
jgi:hypothetical protein